MEKKERNFSIQIRSSIKKELDTYCFKHKKKVVDVATSMIESGLKNATLDCQGMDDNMGKPNHVVVRSAGIQTDEIRLQALVMLGYFQDRDALLSDFVDNYVKGLEKNEQEEIKLQEQVLHMRMQRLSSE